MIWNVIHKELLTMSRKGVFWVLTGSFILLMMTSLTICYLYHRSAVQQIEVASALSREHWEEQGDKNQHGAAHYGVHIFKPRSFLALWDNGVERFTGSTIFVEPHKRNNSMFKSVHDEPVLSRWGEFTPSFLILIFLPLIIIWVAHNMVSGEKEKNTLKLTLTQGGDLLRLIAGKAIALYIICLGMILPAVLITLVAFSSTDIALPALPDLCLLLTFYLLYLGIVIHICLGVSAICRHSGTAMSILVSFWILTFWVGPRLGNSIVAGLVPGPMESEFQKALADDVLQNGISGHNTKSARSKAFIEATLAKYEVDHPDKLPFNFSGFMLQVEEDSNDVIFDQHYQKLYARYHRQAEVMRLVNILSPYGIIKELSMGICRTDLSAHIHFMESTDRYRMQFLKVLNDDLMKMKAENGRQVIRSASFWKEVPTHEHSPITTKAVMQKQGANIWLLLTWSMLSLIFLTICCSTLRTI